MCHKEDHTLSQIDKLLSLLSWNAKCKFIQLSRSEKESAIINNLSDFEAFHATLCFISFKQSSLLSLYVFLRLPLCFFRKCNSSSPHRKNEFRSRVLLCVCSYIIGECTWASCISACSSLRGKTIDYVTFSETIHFKDRDKNWSKLRGLRKYFRKYFIKKLVSKVSLIALRTKEKLFTTTCKGAHCHKALNCSVKTWFFFATYAAWMYAKCEKTRDINNFHIHSL